MKILKTFFMAMLAMSILTLSSCKDDDEQDQEQPPAATGQMKIKFDHVWGPARIPFSLNQEFEHPATGDSMTFTKLRYYVSNIRLHKTDGSEWAPSENYFIVDASDAEPTIELSKVPTGSYTGMTYLIGVDSLRNVSGAQTGALDPAENMFWTWTTGYIFIKAEGESPQSPMGTFTYHIGGFSGPNSAIRENHANFDNTTLDIAVNANPAVHLYVNAARFWHGGIMIEDMPMVHMPGENASTLANNFARGIEFDHIHN
jgi:hypothetical protein